MNEAGTERSRLESVARGVASEWGIVIGSPFVLSNNSYVAPAGPNAVLKITSPDDEESIHEADALALWAGDGAVRLLRVDRSRRALLLERASPGSDLAALDSEAAITIGVDVAARLWRPAAPPFRWVREHVQRRYVAIDPKPMLGEPEFDVPPFLWNPLGSQMTREETERRLVAFTEAGLDETRMRAWALIRGAYLDVGGWIGEHAVATLEAIQRQ